MGHCCLQDKVDSLKRNNTIMSIKQIAKNLIQYLFGKFGPFASGVPEVVNKI